MANGKKGTAKGESLVGGKCPSSLAIAAKGITTGQDFALLMSTLMSDLISGAVKPMIGNAVCNAGGKLLKVVEMQMKYGTPQQSGNKVLMLTAPGSQSGFVPTEVAGD